jgi:hypothetical protein
MKLPVSNLKFQIIALAACLTLCYVRDANACNVPVFRYALERWRQDSYRVTVFHRGELAEKESELVRLLQGRQDEGVANFVFGVVNADKLDDAGDKELFAALGEAKLPLLVVQYPAKLGHNGPLWSAPFTRENAEALVDSPVRKELVKRLADGQTAVWLVLESEDAEQNKKAVALVEAELKKLEKDLKLPELSEDPADKLAPGPPLAIAFSLLRVARGDAERPLVAALLASEPDLAERTEPLVFPVFGRGRALFPLVGAGITAENLHDSAAFLVGACSCEVKELNPGFDLLLTANWEELLTSAGVALPAALPDVATPSETPVLVPIPRGSQPRLPVATETSAAASPAPAAQTNVRLFVVGGISVGSVLGIALLVLALMPRGNAAAR